MIKFIAFFHCNDPLYKVNEYAECPNMNEYTFCTDCQATGVPLNVAKELMGHSDISVTAKIYTHMVDEAFAKNRKQSVECAN